MKTASPIRPARGRSAARLTVFGVVQGVGFRPYVYRLARGLGLDGWVENAGSGVEIHVEGPSRIVRSGFPAALRDGLPPLAVIEKLDVRPAPLEGRPGFEIRQTRDRTGFVFISPDIATCPDCAKEIETPGERRYRYAFTNCTNCGPRYTIVNGLPYDRSRTTMAGFTMCPDCRREYEDPLDRRHHAQPIACPVCGPRLTLLDARSGRNLRGDIPEAVALIRAGQVLAVKGLGGFHLVCDPFNAAAVTRLRRTKARRTKPLALMARDLAAVRRFAVVSPAERELLLSPRRPIVLLKKKKDIPLIAPGLDEIGFMLPYTPLHRLLLERLELIVATSSNAKDAPIIKEEREGVRGLCRAVLTHDRPIAMRADDSVVKVVAGRPLFVRRARGYVPTPQSVPEALRSDRVLVALGGELKDTISLYKNGYVVTSQFLGDLDDYRNFGYFEETLAHLLRLFDARPEAVVSDLHPDFRTTRYASRMGLPHFRVQHHHAHVLAPLLEHGHVPRRRVLGVALDGYGYGADGTAWGGEFLLADYRDFERLARFEPVPLPGGDLAAREPWRMALAWLDKAFGGAIPDLAALRRIGRSRRATVLQMSRSGFRSPLTSSCGRLFDAVSFIAGAAPERLEFEAEAAMRFEAAADRAYRGRYPIEMTEAGPGRPAEISFAPLLRALVRDVQEGVSVGVVSAKFHDALAVLIVRVAETARRVHGTEDVSLAGGVFLNRRLLESAERKLEAKGFRVFRPLAYSPNDESLSVGQIAWGLAKLRSGGA
ncbi:MAG: carbamoyltransferase HypF [Candidatus Aminicenantales bacterium]